MVIGIYGQKMPYLLSYTFATKQMSKAPVDPKELHNNLRELILSYPHKVLLSENCWFFVRLGNQESQR